MKLSWLAPWLFGAAVRCQQPTTAAVFLPGYGNSDWSALRGSVVASDNALTTYTVFCEEQAQVLCTVAGNLPFVFAESPETLVYSASIAGEITADLSCALAGTTAATCAGSTSIAAGYGGHLGALSTTWTTTLGSADVTWGTLTLTTPGSTAVSSASGRRDPSVTLAASQTIVSGTSLATATSHADGRHRLGRQSRAAVVAGLLVAILGFWIC